MSVLMSQRAFAKHIGRSVGYVNKLVKSGVIPLHGPQRKIRPDEAVAAIEAAKDPTRDPQREANERRRNGGEPSGLLDPKVAPEKSLADLSEEEREALVEAERRRLEELRSEAAEKGVDLSMPSDIDGMSLNEVKVFKEFFQGKLAELDYRKKSGELLDAEDVRRQAYETAQTVKAALLALPHKLSVRIAGMRDPKEIEAALDEEIRQVLEELSGGVE